MRRIGSACSLAKLRNVSVSIELSHINSRRAAIAHFVAHRRQDEIVTRGAVLALFQSHHVQAGFGQFARHDGAGPTQPDRDRIDFFQSRHHVRLPLYEKSAIDCGSAT